jgi:Ca2+-binding EF-hand superfamily protein
MMTNINGFSAPDMTALYQSLFKKVDADGSGGIDKTEFQTAVSGMTGKDAASDELDAMFAKLDTDGNGTVDDSEMMSALKEMGEQRRTMMPPPPPPPMGGPNGREEELTDEDKTSVASILAQYDASNLTEEDAKAINQAFRDAGISFGKSLGDAVEEAGFSVQTLMELDPPQRSGNTENASNAMFANLIDSLQSTDETGSTSMFSELIDYLSSNEETDDDRLSALFKNLINNIQNSSAYNQSGNVSVYSTAYQSLLSVFA